MPPSVRSQQIAGQFCKFADNGDKSLIEEFSEEEIERTLIQYAADKGFPHYSAMEMCLAGLQERRRDILSQKEREAERREGYKTGLITGIISGVIGGLVVALLVHLLGWA